MAKRGYRLQEFVAHASNVNCLNIGKKSSRLLVTGGEDQKVNLWAIGKPTSLLSLSGHTSPVESVTFDSGEVLVASGASFGVIKLWDLEEAKILRTLTGHRSSCNALQFHPFGEFFASGSSDASLKIWDVRKKGCIHTYKGHTRGVSTIKFTPDGRWVVSGGADNVVKIWDLTAGKLLHEFKFHEGQIQCIEFHPLEFLLATGSEDKTVKFWDLETFEMIGSAGPEATGVRAMAFHPDGKTLFCGLEDSLKVFSWEPIVCHDSVDMGWSTLGDLSINEGKLLGCSYYHNCVGVWATDISLFGPYVAGVPPRSSGYMQQKFEIQESQALQKVGDTVNFSTGVPTDPQDNGTPEIRNIYMDTCGSNKITPKRMGSINSSNVALSVDSSETSIPDTLKKSIEVEVHSRSSSHMVDRQFPVPLVVHRNNPCAENVVSTKREEMMTEATAHGMMLKPTNMRRASNFKYETEKFVTNESGRFGSKLGGSNISPDRNCHSRLLPKVESKETVEDRHKDTTSVVEKFERILSPEVQLKSNRDSDANSKVCNRETGPSRKVNKALLGRTRSLVERWEKRETCSSDEASANTAPTSLVSESHTSTFASTNTAPTSVVSESHALPHMSSNIEQKEQPQTSGRDSTSMKDESVLEDIMRNHEPFMSSFHSRLAKLQVVRYFWQRNDLKGGLNAVGKLPDHSVQADVVSVLIEKMDIVSLELFSCLLPMLLGLLNSQTDRHTNVALEMLLKLVAIFGPVIRSTMSASPSIGVDLQAERRRECCTHCFMQLQKIKQIIPSIIRRGGILARYAQELNLLQES